MKKIKYFFAFLFGKKIQNDYWGDGYCWRRTSYFKKGEVTFTLQHWIMPSHKEFLKQSIEAFHRIEEKKYKSRLKKKVTDRLYYFKNLSSEAKKS